MLPEVVARRRPARAGCAGVDGVPPQRRARRGSPRLRPRERVRRPLRDRALSGESGCPRLRARARRRHRGARCRGDLLRSVALPRPRARLRARALFRPARRAGARYLLGLCFCEHCLAAARAAGVDGEAVRRAAREEIERAFAGDGARGGEPERDEYARVREQVVTSLVAEVAEAAGETPFEFMELSGAVKGYADGSPPATRRPRSRGSSALTSTPSPAPVTGSRRWATPPTRSASAATSTPTATTRSPSSSARRPPTPTRPRTCVRRSTLARERGLRRVDFYHYGLMRLDALDWIRDALTP